MLSIPQEILHTIHRIHPRTHPMAHRHGLVRTNAMENVVCCVELEGNSATQVSGGGVVVDRWEEGTGVSGMNLANEL